MFLDDHRKNYLPFFEKLLNQPDIYAIIFNVKKHNKTEKGEKPLQPLRYCKIDEAVTTHWFTLERGQL